MVITCGTANHVFEEVFCIRVKAFKPSEENKTRLPPVKPKAGKPV